MTLSISLATITPVVIGGSANAIAKFAPNGYKRSKVSQLIPTVNFNINTSKTIRAAATSNVAEVFELTLSVLEAEKRRLVRMNGLQQKRIAIDGANWQIAIGDGIDLYCETGTTTPSKSIYTGTATVQATEVQVEYYATFLTEFTRFDVTPPDNGSLWWTVNILAVGN